MQRFVSERGRLLDMGCWLSAKGCGALRAGRAQGVGVTLGCAVLLLAGAARAGERICLEAESAAKVEAPMQVTEEAKAPALPDGTKVKGASGGKYLEVPQGKGNPPKVDKGRAELTFEVKKGGTFYLWGRAWWEDDCGNSFSISIDGAKAFSFGQDGTHKTWHWVKAPRRLKQLELEPGKHTLTIKNREDGARLDQILLTTNKRYVPVDAEKPTVSKGD